MRGFKVWLELFDYETHPEVPNLVQTKLDRNGNYKIVVIDVDKFDAAWNQDRGYYLPPGGSGDNYIAIHDRTKPPGYNRYNRVGEEAPRFKSEGKDFDMPTVGLKPGGIPAFTDGRHRFAYFRDKGIKRLPVSVPTHDYHKMKKLFGL